MKLSLIPNGLREIAFGARCDLKTYTGRKISNMTGGVTWVRSYNIIHTHLVDIVYKFE